MAAWTLTWKSWSLCDTTPGKLQSCPSLMRCCFSGSKRGTGPPGRQKNGSSPSRYCHNIASKSTASLMIEKAPWGWYLRTQIITIATNLSMPSSYSSSWYVCPLSLRMSFFNCPLSSRLTPIYSSYLSLDITFFVIITPNPSLA